MVSVIRDKQLYINLEPAKDEKRYHSNAIFDVLVKFWLLGDEYWSNPIPCQGR